MTSTTEKGTTKIQQEENESEYFKPRKLVKRTTKVEALVEKPTSTKGAFKQAKRSNLLREGAKYEVRNGQLTLVEEPEEVQLNIVPSEDYRSRDGRKIRVFAVNKDSAAFPVVGMIDCDGEWRPQIWNIEGLTKRPYGPGNDIVAMWTES